MKPKTKEQISKNMSAVRNKDSKIELLLRKELWSRGLRYRKNVQSIYGKPDIAFIGKKIAVFCDSEFWHGYNWEERKTAVSSFLSGRTFKITLDKDPDYYYEGRCYVSEYISDRKKRTIVVKASVNPYKFKQEETVITVVGIGKSTAYTIRNSRKAVCPEITCTSNMAITFNDVSYRVNAGTYKILDIQFKEGENVVTVFGGGNVTFRFREGAL